MPLSRSRQESRRGERENMYESDSYSYNSEDYSQAVRSSTWLGTSQMTVAVGRGCTAEPKSILALEKA